MARLSMSASESVGVGCGSEEGEDGEMECPVKREEIQETRENGGLPTEESDQHIHLVEVSGRQEEAYLLRA